LKIFFNQVKDILSPRQILTKIEKFSKINIMNKETYNKLQ